MYKFSLSVCLFVSNKSRKGWTDRAHIFCVISRDQEKVYGWSNFWKFASIKIRFLKFLKIHEIFFYKIREIFCFCFIKKEKVTIPAFTNEIKVGALEAFFLKSFPNWMVEGGEGCVKKIDPLYSSCSRFGGKWRG